MLSGHSIMDLFITINILVFHLMSVSIIVLVLEASVLWPLQGLIQKYYFPHISLEYNHLLK